MNYQLGSKLLSVFTLLIATLVAVGYSQYQGAQNAHVVFTGDSIITMSESSASASHVAIHGDTIIAVGDQESVAQHVRWFTRFVELGDQTLMPGLIEPHTHPVLAAVFSEWLDVSGFTYTKSADIYAALRDAVQTKEKGEWLFAFGLDPVLTPDLKAPNRDILDEIAPHNPIVIVSQVIHTAWVNSAVLELAGIDDDVVDPVGGHFERDQAGRLTGVAHEEAMKMILVPAESGWLQKLKLALNTRTSFIRQYNDYAKAGITSIGVLGPAPMFEGYLGFLEHIATRRNTPIRTFVMPLAGELEKSNYPLNYSNGKYHVLGVKLHLDGSPWTGGMATAEPYLMNEFTQGKLNMSEGNRGVLKYSPGEYIEKVVNYHRDGWQVAVHAHGERAHRLALDAFEAAQQAYPRADTRHRMEHLGLFDSTNIDRAAMLGVTPSFFIDHIYYFGPVIRDHLLGAERAERFMALRTATERMERVTLHMDSPATPIDPWRMLKTATTRIPRSSDQPLNTKEIMSVRDALEAVTIDAAWQLKAEDRLGSIEVGKQADLVILNKSPLTTSTKNWDSIQAQATWLAGKKVKH